MTDFDQEDSSDSDFLSPDATGSKRLPVSTGALGVQLLYRTLRELGVNRDEIFGQEQRTVKVWDEKQQRVIKRKVTKRCDALNYCHNQIVDCFHGGRNETFFAGPTPLFAYDTEISVHDFDLKGAYTSGLLLIRLIDYAAAFQTRNVDDFLGDKMGFATVKFKFPACIRYPGLPVHSEVRGLIYPLCGVSYATAPEIELAVQQNADLTIQSGVVLPWKTDSNVRVFQGFVREIRRLRQKYPKKSLYEQIAKLLGNSVYGKLAQGLGSKTAFDTASLQSKPVPTSGITNAPMAALTTGFIRAVVGEILHRLPANRRAYTVTTDGIQTDAPLHEIDISGPLCQRFLHLCELVETDMEAVL